MSVSATGFQQALEAAANNAKNEPSYSLFGSRSVNDGVRTKAMALVATLLPSQQVSAPASRPASSTKSEREEKKEAPKDKITVREQFCTTASGREDKYRNLERQAQNTTNRVMVVAVVLLAIGAGAYLTMR